MSRRSKKQANRVTEEDRRLFLEAVGGLDGHPERSPNIEALLVEDEIPSASDDERQLFLKALDDVSVSAIKEHSAQLSPKKRSKKSKIDATLDLHGFTREIAIIRVKAFLERAVSRHLRQVLIIHGKGSGVLRQQVRQILAEHAMVSFISQAPPRLGGQGAVVVDLKKAR